MGISCRGDFHCSSHFIVISNHSIIARFCIMFYSVFRSLCFSILYLTFHIIPSYYKVVQWVLLPTMQEVERRRNCPSLLCQYRFVSIVTLRVPEDDTLRERESCLTIYCSILFSLRHNQSTEVQRCMGTYTIDSSRRGSRLQAGGGGAVHSLVEWRSWQAVSCSEDECSTWTQIPVIIHNNCHTAKKLTYKASLILSLFTWKKNIIYYQEKLFQCVYDLVILTAQVSLFAWIKFANRLQFLYHTISWSCYSIMYKNHLHGKRKWTPVISWTGRPPFCEDSFSARRHQCESGFHIAAINQSIVAHTTHNLIEYVFTIPRNAKVIFVKQRMFTVHWSSLNMSSVHWL